MTGFLFQRRRPLHTCYVPPLGEPENVDPGDIWRCRCGRYWRARAGYGRRFGEWRPIPRWWGHLLVRGRTPIPYWNRNDLNRSEGTQP